MMRAMPCRSSNRCVSKRFGAAMERCWSRAIAASIGRAVVSATGTWTQPFIPIYLGHKLFQGIQIHSADYPMSQLFVGQRVLVIGGGNSSVQILAEVSQVAETTWVTPEPPRFLPDDVDGAIRACDRAVPIDAGRAANRTCWWVGDIVMVPSVKQARPRGVLHSVRPFVSFMSKGVRWADGHETDVDAVIGVPASVQRSIILCRSGLSRRMGMS
jgi:putative flavoprotein involved in K+ transport